MSIFFLQTKSVAQKRIFSAYFDGFGLNKYFLNVWSENRKKNVCDRFTNELTKSRCYFSETPLRSVIRKFPVGLEDWGSSKSFLEYF